MRRKICVVTGTRAEYGLLYWVMKGINDDPDLELQICATGMHLSPEFGLTYKIIENDGFKISKKVVALLSSDSAVGISKSIGLTIIGFAEAFDELEPDILLLLGDRFEVLAAATAATIARIPIAHCHGGESTEGLIDEAIRHSVTKMSHLHFTSASAYRKRVVQLGEDPANVYQVGALGIENINKLHLLSREALEGQMDFQLGDRNVLVTFHPVTLENGTAMQQFMALLEALDEFSDVKAIFTLPNADTDGRVIIKLIEEFVHRNHHRAKAFVSLGQLRYLSLLKFVHAVIGNSSSGLIEVPSFKTATINIGDRQRGRIMADSVINCEPEKAAIVKSIQLALSADFRRGLSSIENPYGRENSLELIIPILKSADLDNLVKKKFHNIS